MAITPSSPDPDDPASEALAALRQLAATSPTSEELQWAVDAARVMEASWQSIGEVLDMRRGAAYQRFRRRPRALRLEIQLSSISGVSVLTARGELDVITGPRVTDAISTGLAKASRGLIVDCSWVTFLATAGMAVLVEGRQAARRESKRFGVVADGPITSRPMVAMGLDQIIAIYRTVDEALADLG